MMLFARQLETPPAAADNDYPWVIAQTAAAYFGLIAVVAAVATLLSERVRRVREQDERRFTSGASSTLGCFHAELVSWPRSLLGKRTAALKVPSIAGLIEAGDRCAWTSSALDLILENYSEQTWVKLYELLLTSIASQTDKLPKEWMNQEPVPTFLARVSSDGHKQDHIIPEMWHTRQTAYRDEKLISACRQLEVVKNPLQQQTRPERNEREIHRGLSRLTSTWIVRGRACIGTTREELAALAIIMGMAFTKQDSALYLTGFGGFGLSIDISHADSSWSGCFGARFPTTASRAIDGGRLHHPDGEASSLWQYSVRAERGLGPLRIYH